MRTFRLAAAPALCAALLAASSPVLAEGPAPQAPAPAKAPEPVKHGSRVPGVLVMLLGLGGVGMGAAFQIISINAANDAKAQCNGNLCPPAAEGDTGRSRNFEGAARGAFIGGGVVALTGVVLILARPGDDGDTTTARVSPWIGRNGGGLGITGRF